MYTELKQLPNFYGAYTDGHVAEVAAQYHLAAHDIEQVLHNARFDQFATAHAALDVIRNTPPGLDFANANHAIVLQYQTRTCGAVVSSHNEGLGRAEHIGNGEVLAAYAVVELSGMFSNLPFDALPPLDLIDAAGPASQMMRAYLNLLDPEGDLGLPRVENF